MEDKLQVKENRNTIQIKAAGFNIFGEVSRGVKNEGAFKELNIYPVRRRKNSHRGKLLAHSNGINSVYAVTQNSWV
jgi:hypothetical protein